MTRATLAHVAAVATAAAFGWLVASWPGLFVGLVATPLAALRRPRWVLGALVIAGVAASTILTFTGGPLEVAFNYATRRNEAADVMAYTLIAFLSLVLAPGPSSNEGSDGATLLADEWGDL